MIPRILLVLLSAMLISNADVRSIQILANHQDVPLGIKLGPDERAQFDHGSISQAKDGEIRFTPTPGFVGKTSVVVTKGTDRASYVEIDVRQHPNFVFILTDDQSWTSLSTRMDKGNPASQSDYHRTPNIDRLAQEGMRFSRGYSPAPNCSPTRYANLTGKTCARLKFTDIVGRGHTTKSIGQRLIPINKETREIRSEETTLPELLKTLPKVNYRTAHWGKWHLKGGGPERHGFDESDGETGNREGSKGKVVNPDPKRAYSITTRANAFIERAVRDTVPFYCQVSHYAVHAKIQHRASTLKSLGGIEPGKNHVDPSYAAMVADLDAAVGRLLEKLDDLGLRHSTYVIYQADNGAPKFMSNAYPLRRYKPEIWEGGIRVPTFFRGPGIAAESQSNQAMMGIDIMPTIWDLAGGSKSSLSVDIDGASIAPLLRGKTGKKPNRPGELVVHSPHYVLSKDQAKNQRPSTAIHDGPWKLVAWYETGEIHLFNLEQDISESLDVGNKHPGEKLRLWRRLRDYLDKVDAQMPVLDPGHGENPGSVGDADADGLPDQWEFAQLLTHALGPGDDPDDDGVTNKAEHAAGSDPLRR
jgi:arylsulfatase A-like enzyme